MRTALAFCVLLASLLLVQAAPLPITIDDIPNADSLKYINYHTGFKGDSRPVLMMQTDSGSSETLRVLFYAKAATVYPSKDPIPSFYYLIRNVTTGSTESGPLNFAPWTTCVIQDDPSDTRMKPELFFDPNHWSWRTQDNTIYFVCIPIFPGQVSFQPRLFSTKLQGPNDLVDVSALINRFPEKAYVDFAHNNILLLSAQDGLFYVPHGSLTPQAVVEIAQPQSNLTVLNPIHVFECAISNGELLIASSYHGPAFNISLVYQIQWSAGLYDLAIAYQDELVVWGSDITEACLSSCYIVGYLTTPSSYEAWVYRYTGLQFTKIANIGSETPVYPNYETFSPWPNWLAVDLSRTYVYFTFTLANSSINRMIRCDTTGPPLDRPTGFSGEGARRVQHFYFARALVVSIGYPNLLTALDDNGTQLWTNPAADCLPVGASYGPYPGGSYVLYCIRSTPTSGDNRPTLGRIREDTGLTMLTIPVLALEPYNYEVGLQALPFAVYNVHFSIVSSTSGMNGEGFVLYLASSTFTSSLDLKFLAETNTQLLGITQQSIATDGYAPRVFNPYCFSNPSRRSRNITDIDFTIDAAYDGPYKSPSAIRTFNSAPGGTVKLLKMTPFTAGHSVTPLLGAVYNGGNLTVVEGANGDYFYHSSDDLGNGPVDLVLTTFYAVAAGNSYSIEYIRCNNKYFFTLRNYGNVYSASELCDCYKDTVHTTGFLVSNVANFVCIQDEYVVFQAFNGASALIAWDGASSSSWAVILDSNTTTTECQLEIHDYNSEMQKLAVVCDRSSIGTAQLILLHLTSTFPAPFVGAYNPYTYTQIVNYGYLSGSANYVYGVVASGQVPNSVVRIPWDGSYSARVGPIGSGFPIPNGGMILYSVNATLFHWGDSHANPVLVFSLNSSFAFTFKAVGRERYVYVGAQDLTTGEEFTVLLDLDADHPPTLEEARLPFSIADQAKLLDVSGFMAFLCHTPAIGTQLCISTLDTTPTPHVGPVVLYLPDNVQGNLNLSPGRGPVVIVLPQNAIINGTISVGANVTLEVGSNATILGDFTTSSGSTVSIAGQTQINGNFDSQGNLQVGTSTVITIGSNLTVGSGGTIDFGTGGGLVVNGNAAFGSNVTISVGSNGPSTLFTVDGDITGLSSVTIDDINGAIANEVVASGEVTLHFASFSGANSANPTFALQSSIGLSECQEIKTTPKTSPNGIDVLFSLQTVDNPACSAQPPNILEIEGWKVAVIVVCAVIGVAAIITAVVTVLLKRREKAESQRLQAKLNTHS